MKSQQTTEVTEQKARTAERIAKLPEAQREQAQIRASASEEQRLIQRRTEARWNEAWAQIAKDPSLPAHRHSIGRKDDRLHQGLSKAESALAIQIRTEKIGLAAFLAQRRVPL